MGAALGHQIERGGAGLLLSLSSGERGAPHDMSVQQYGDMQRAATQKAAPLLGAEAIFPEYPVSVIDTATNTVVASIPVGAIPFAVAITPAPQAPKSKEECKRGGYLKFGPPAGPFKNQGQCVRYVEHH